MQKMLTLARRELAAYFFSPMAYVVGFLFLLLVSVVFLWGMEVPFLGISIKPVFHSGAESTLGPLFDVLAYGLVVVVPLLTMRLVAEEFRAGTIETLMTAPITDAQVIGGKFLGAMGTYVALLLTTIVYFLLVAAYGRPDWGVVGLGYLGMLLLGAAYVSVGVFASTVTPHQLVAGLVGIGILAAFTAGPYLLAQLLPVGRAGFADSINMIKYFGHFSRGMIDSRAIIFLLTTTAFFLFLSVKVLESRRWR